MPTEKLYWEDPFASSFEASRARVASFGGGPSVVLERTLFYPEAGGQLADTGTLHVGGRDLQVTDVQIDDATGDIHHLVPDLAAALAEAGMGAELPADAAVRGTIDVARRRDHMAQHTAQHMLSRALAEVARAETVSARLGATSCTIDLGLADVHEHDLAQAEDLVNAVVMDDRLVRALFPTAAELAGMKLRREPKVQTNVRIIDVEGFDLSPCGGTHCTRTGQIGAVRIAGTERYKGKLRLSFHAGRRSLQDARAKLEVLGALAQDFTCGPLDVPTAVAKLRAELRARLEALSMARGELVELVAQQFLAAHPPDPGGETRLVLVREKDDVTMLRNLAGRLAARADVVAFCASPDPATGELAIVVQRGSATPFDCGGWLRAAAAAQGGRGGGRPERAEGRLLAGSDLAALSRV